MPSMPDVHRLRHRRGDPRKWGTRAARLAWRCRRLHRRPHRLASCPRLAPRARQERAVPRWALDARTEIRRPPKRHASGSYTEEMPAARGCAQHAHLSNVIIDAVDQPSHSAPAEPGHRAPEPGHSAPWRRRAATWRRHAVALAASNDGGSTSAGVIRDVTGRGAALGGPGWVKRTARGWHISCFEGRASSRRVRAFRMSTTRSGPSLA